MTIADQIFGDPALVALLAVVIRAVVAYQRGLSWYEYRTLHGLKRLLFPRLDGRVGVSLVNEKGGVSDDEFVGHRTGSVKTIARTLVRAGGSYHLVCSIKRRHLRGRRQEYSAAHVVWFHDDDTQTEAYLFKHKRGVDVYAHHETAVTDPDGHIENTQQVDGDPRGIVTAALWPERAGTTAQADGE